MAQLNPTVGDIEGNTTRVTRIIREGKEMGADLVIFPELVITGYPPRDLVEKESFVASNLKKLKELAQGVDHPSAIVGFIDKNPSPIGKSVFNAAALLEKGKVKSIHHKTLLPTYDVFDEGRYFEAAEFVHLADCMGKKAGISICEDAWNDEDFWQQRKYLRDPIEEQVNMGAEILINISASPYSVGKPALRKRMLSNQAAKYKKAILFVNQIGGNDDLIFDGHSYIFSPEGSIAYEGKSFDEDLILIDLEKPFPMVQEKKEKEIEEIYKALILGTRDYIKKCGFSKVVMGISGGIDSSVVAVLAVEAIGAENILGVMMPSQYSSKEGMEDARQLMRNLNIKFQTIPIENIFGSYLKELSSQFKGQKSDITEENIQARIRGNILMAISNKFGHLVITTGNKSEMAVGYCTLYGDMSGGLAVISDVPKTMVYELARFINRMQEIIPGRVLTRAPSAELKPDQTDQDALPPYEVLDPILKHYVEDGKGVQEIVALGFEEELVKMVINMVDKNEYKRNQAPVGLKITTKAFGKGRRMPIAQKFQED